MRKEGRGIVVWVLTVKSGKRVQGRVEKKGKYCLRTNDTQKKSFKWAFDFVA